LALSRGGYPVVMASVQAPQAQHRSNGRADEAPVARWAGDDAVPRGLAVTSAVTLRVLIVVGGIVLLGLFAKLMMVVVVPLIIAVLLATLLAPVAGWLRRRRLGPGLASFLPVVLAFIVFVGLWGLVIPPFVSQVPDLVDNVQRGAGQVADFAKPLGVSAADIDRAIEKAREQLSSGRAAGQLLSGALLVTQWAAAVVLIAVLTFFFLKDGTQIRDWLVSLFARERRPVLNDVLDRAWDALATYIQGVFLVATIDAGLIGIALLAVGVPIAFPLIVLTFLAAFFPVVGSIVAGAACVLVALVANGAGAALIILIAIVAVQQLEGNVFYPVVVGKRLRLHPVAILLALTAGGVLAGVAGAFLAIPVAAVISAVLDYMRTRRREEGPEALITP
jgi:predicted PurR-regulated permease PerM